MPDDSVFFEIAAGLLPALMLAGLLSDKLKPAGESFEAPPWQFWLILISGGYFVFAEVVAISTAISGEPQGFNRLVVSIALIAAAVGTVGLVLAPWMERVVPEKRPVEVGGVAVVLLIIGVSSVVLLNKAISDASEIENLRELLARDAAQRKDADALFAQQRRLDAKEGRLERELTTLTIRRADLLAGPREPDTRSKVFLIGQDLRAIRSELKLNGIEQRGITMQLEVLAADEDALRSLAP